VDDKASQLVEYFQSQALHFRTRNLIHTFGEDFTYITAGTWYKNIDKLMKRINNDPSFSTKLVYSTPGKYISAIFGEGQAYPVKNDDFFPYSDVEHGYWSGYYVSRTALKLMVRDYGRWMQSARTFVAIARLRGSAYWQANEAAILRDLQAAE
jgi:lysosomal alpha-mannosidase